MIEQRVDRLIAELTARYELQERFIKQLRPAIERIFSDEIPEDRRPYLLEVVAQTCQNDLMIRRRFSVLESALKDLFTSLNSMTGRLKQIEHPDRTKTDASRSSRGVRRSFRRRANR